MCHLCDVVCRSSGVGHPLKDCALLLRPQINKARRGQEIMVRKWVILLIIVCLSPTIAASSVSDSELFALHTLYNVTHGDDWDWRSEVTDGPVWNFSSYPDVDPCNDDGQVWQGLICSSAPVVCNVEKCNITSLDLGEYDLRGPIPIEISTLLSLTRLVLTGNGLTGLFPPQLSSLVNLTYLSVSYNELSGTLPTTLGKLVYIDISFNKFWGTLPVDYAVYPYLEHVMVTSNKFTGTIPSSICSLSSVTKLNLGSNPTHGHIPECMGFMSILRTLDISDTSTSGSIPSTLGMGQSLADLTLDRTRLQGTLPVELANCTALKIFQGSDNSFEGSIPSQWGSMASLSDFRIASAGLNGSLFAGMGHWQHLNVKIDLSGNSLTGTIPASFGSLTKVVTVLLSYNCLTGTIPSELGCMSHLKYLYVNDNRLNGSIPDTFQQLTVLESLYLENNKLTGPIPTVLFKASRLIYLFLQGNSLTGPIPSQLGLLSKLYRLGLSSNSLTGPIPDAIADSTLLRLFAAEDNFLTGLLPSGFQKNHRLETLRLSRNALSGPLLSPSENWNINIVDVQFNFLTGPIPSAFALLSSLRSLNVNNNLMTGTLLSGFSYARKLLYLEVQHNFFTGRLPEDLGQVPLVEINFQQNALSGTLPASFGNITSLEVLLGNGNKLTGHLQNILWQAPSMHLQILDVSDNLLEGSIPQSVFIMPYLRVLALTYNCFHGKLPKSICNATRMDVLSLDGLSAQRMCADSKHIPFSSARVHRKLEGSLPSCIFEVSSLQALYLSGNGLSGTLAEIADSAKLVNLSISHNRLFGTIPKSIRARPWVNLDLSYNKFQGECSHFSESTSNQSFALDVNRLSGKYPRTLLHARKARVLADNLFACDGSPLSDSSTDEYSCGSTELDASMYAPCVACAVLMCLVLAAMLGHYNVVKDNFVVDGLVSWSGDILNNIAFSDLCIAKPEFVHLSVFCRTLKEIPRDVCAVMVAGLVCCLPIYVLKVMDMGQSSTDYATHSHLYAWTVSMVYVTGKLPATLLLLGGLGSLFVVILGWRWKTRTFRKLLSTSPSPTSVRSISDSVVLYVVLIINLCVVAAVNGLYVYFTLREMSGHSKLLIQFSMAAFKSLYGIAIIPACSAMLVDRDIDKTWFTVTSLIFNGIIAPAVVTAFTSPSCFQGLLVDPAPFNSAYSYVACSATVELGARFFCVEYAEVSVDVIPVTPPLTYNYMCTSVLLAAYIPVYLYVYGLQIILQLLVPVLRRQWVSMPASIRRMEHGMLWPDNWSPDSHSSWQLLKSHTVVSSFLGHIALLLTFGLFFPPLALSIVVTCALYSMQIRWMLGGFIRHRMKSIRPLYGHDDGGEGSGVGGEKCLGLFHLRADLAVICLEKNASHWIEAVERCLWFVAATVSLFYAVLCWDLAGDDTGWKYSAWVPISVFCFLCVMMVYMRGCLRLSIVRQHVRKVLRHGVSWCSKEPRAEKSTQDGLEIVGEEHWSSLHSTSQKNG